MSPEQTIRQLRTTVAASIGVLAALLVVLPTLGAGETHAHPIAIAVPGVVGLAELVLLPAVGSTVRPLPPSVPADDAARISAGVLRTLTMLRLAVAEAPALAGLVVAFVVGSVLPFAVGFLFSVVPLAVWVYPRERVLAALRERLEAAGTKSHL